LSHRFVVPVQAKKFEATVLAAEQKA